MTESSGFVLVKTVPKMQSGPQRGAQGITIEPSGRSMLNVSGTDMQDSVAKARGLHKEEYVVVFLADAIRSMIKVVPARMDAEGAVPIRRTDRNIFLHLGGVFDEYPALRPVGKRSCMVNVDYESDGKPFLVIGLNTALVKRTRSANTNAKTGKTEGAKAEPAKAESAKAEGTKAEAAKAETESGANS